MLATGRATGTACRCRNGSTHLRVDHRLFGSLAREGLSRAVSTAGGIVTVTGRGNCGGVSRVLLIKNDDHVPRVGRQMSGRFGYSTGLASPSRYMTGKTTVCTVGTTCSRTIHSCRRKRDSSGPTPLHKSHAAIIGIADGACNASMVVRKRDVIRGLVFTGDSLPAGQVRAFAASVPGRQNMSIGMFRDSFAGVRARDVIRREFYALVSSRALGLDGS